jgi:hypothetical protein
MRVTLQPHPATPCAALDALEVQVHRHAGGGLELHFFAQGRTKDVLWPEGAAGERADRLWETTCFEAFVKPVGRSGYGEFNFSPSTRWQAYSFTGERAGMAEARGMTPPETRMRMTERSRVHHVRLDPGSIPGIPADAEWALGLSAVIEQADGTKAYWALRHPSPAPDFHHPDCFALTLAAPEAS